MSEIGTLSLERLNNGAHFLFISNVQTRAETDANVKSKLSAQIVSLKAVHGFRNLPVENMAKAAKVLTQHIKDYAIDPKMQLDKETRHQ